MKTPESNHAVKSERTLLTALLFSAPGPFITVFAAISSRSATQAADFLRRTAELAASSVSWLVFHKIERKKAPDEVYRVRLERIANMTVSLAMLCSGIALCVVGVLSLKSGAEGRKSILGLIVAAMGLLANTIFSLRYRKLAGEQYSSVLAAQQRLYRAKACVDFCVTAALAAGVIAPEHPSTKYIDALGSIAVALYLLSSGASMLKKL